MGFTHVQPQGYGTNGVGSTSLSVTLAQKPQIGSVVCVGFAYGSTKTTPSGIQDGNGNVYTQSPNSPTNNSNTGTASTWYWVVTANPSVTVTASYSSVITPGTVELFVDEFGSDGDITFDKDIKAAGVSGPVVNTPTLTPTFPNELLYALVTTGGNATTINSPWAGTIDGFGVVSEYILSTSTGQNPNITLSPNNAWQAMMMSFFTTGPQGFGNCIDQQIHWGGGSGAF